MVVSNSNLADCRDWKITAAKNLTSGISVGVEHAGFESIATSFDFRKTYRAEFEFRIKIVFFSMRGKA